MASQLISTDKQEIIEMIERASFETVEKDSVIIECNGS